MPQPRSRWSRKGWAPGDDDHQQQKPPTGAIILPTQTSCIINFGKSLKITIHLYCLIPPQMGFKINDPWPTALQKSDPTHDAKKKSHGLHVKQIGFAVILFLPKISVCWLCCFDNFCSWRFLTPTNAHPTQQHLACRFSRCIVRISSVLMILRSTFWSKSDLQSTLHHLPNTTGAMIHDRCYWLKPANHAL